MVHRARRTDAVIAAALAVVALLIWELRILGPASRPYPGFSAVTDVYMQIYPVALRAAEWIRAGHVPLWNPYQFCGQPFLASGIHGVVYPLNFFYLLLPAAVAMQAIVALHVALSAAFTYGFARTIRLSRSSSAVAAVAFPWSGFMIGHAVWFPAAIAAGAWLPLALLAIERTIQTPSPRWPVVLALALGMSFLAGWPQTWIYSVYAAAVYSFARLLAESWTSRDLVRMSKVTVYLGIGAALMAGIMAVQLFPSLELQRVGPRRHGGLSSEQSMWMVAEQAAELAAGVTNASPTMQAPTPYGAYVGVATLLLVVVSPLARQRRGQLIWLWAVFLFAAGVAFVSESPFLAVYRQLPGLAMFRLPGRILFLYVFTAAMLAGIGFQALQEAPRGARRGAALFILVTATSLIALTRIPTEGILILAAAVLLAAGLVLVKSARRRNVLSALLLALVYSDLYHAAYNPLLLPYHDLKPFDDESAVLDYASAHQGHDRTYIGIRSCHPATTPKQGTLRKMYCVTDYEPLCMSRYERFFYRIESERTHMAEFFTFTGALEADPESPGFPLLDLMSVRFLVVDGSDRDFIERLERFRPEWRPIVLPGNTGKAVLYESPHPIPRAYIAHAAMYVDGEDRALDAVASPQFDPRTTVVIEGPASESPGAGGPRPIEAARILEYGPTRVTVECESDAPGYLVLTDTHYPGWRAAVDGKPAAIAQANFLFRAVPVTAGKHTVTYTYTPLSFWAGSAVTAAAIVTMLILLCIDWALWRDARQDTAPVITDWSNERTGPAADSA